LSSDSNGRADLVEQLSDRERTVLRYLDSRLTLREIASECYLSANTVKTHTKAVYRKLGVSSRQEAIAEGRRLQLI
jgi:LuxR family maltose regulon positive regulatory protein